MKEAKIGLAEAQYKDKSFEGSIKTYSGLIAQVSGEFKKLESEFSGKSDSIILARQVEETRASLALFHFQSGLAYEQLGNFEKALEECQLGLEGVSTDIAATALKRIQEKLAAQQKLSGETGSKALPLDK